MTVQYHVLATIAQNPTNDYPFAVVAIDQNGKRSQETLCRSRRDCLLVGNGIATGMMVSGIRCSANTIFDERAFGPITP